MITFKQMEKLLLEADPARPLGNDDSMRLVGTRMSQFPMMRHHQDYQPKHFGHYELKDVPEEKALKTVEELKNIFHGELPYKLSILAGFYNNKTILKVYDDFLRDLRMHAGISI